MVMADDDDDSDNDCLYIDESPTEPDNHGSTSQNPSTQNVLTNNTRNELPKNSAEVPLMEKVNVVKNIPNDIPDIPKDLIVEAEQKARITCKDFSRNFDTRETPPLLKSGNAMKEGSDTNEKIEESALYHYLTTDNPVPPEQEYTSIPNESNQNPFKFDLKQLLDAPSHPPTRPYPPTATVTPYRISSIQSNAKDPRTPPLTDIQNGKQLPRTQASQTSVIVPHPGIPAGGTITLRPTSDQQANNVPTTMRVNGYPVQIVQPSQLNSEANIRQMYSQNTETRTESIGQTSMTNLKGMPYRNCDLNCSCRNGGPIPTSFLNPEPTDRGRGLKNMPLINSQPQPKKPCRGRPRKTAANPYPSGRQGLVDIPSLNTHPPNTALNSYLNGRTGETIDMPPFNNQVGSPVANPDRSGTTVGPLNMPSLSPQPINSNLNSSTEGPMDMPHLNPNLNERTGGPIHRSPLNPYLNDKTERPIETLHSNSNPNGRNGGPMDTPPLNPNFNGTTEGPKGMPHQQINPALYPYLNGWAGGPMDLPHLNPNLNGRTEGSMGLPHLNPNLKGRAERPMGMPYLNPNLNGKTEGPIGMPHLNPNLNGRTEGQMYIPHQQINSALNLYLNGRAGEPMDVPHLNPNLNGKTEGPIDMPHLNPNLNGRVEGPIDIPHQQINSALNPYPNGRAGGPMDVPHFNPNLNGRTRGPMDMPRLNPNLNGRTGGPMDMPHLNPNLYGRTGGPMDMPHLNPNLNGRTVGEMSHLHSNLPMKPALNNNPNGRTVVPMDMSPNHNGRTEGPMNIPHLYPHLSMNTVSNLDLHERTGGQIDMPPQSHQHLSPHLPINHERPIDMPHFNPNLNGREGGYLDIHHLNLVHESMNPSSSPQHEPINPLILQQHCMNKYLVHQHQSINLYMGPKNQPMNPSVSMREERGGDPIILPFNTQHQTTISPINHQFDGRKGGSVNMPPFSPQLQTINPSNSQPVHKSRMLPCYQCSVGKPCNKRLASLHLNAQTGVPMMNSVTVPRNHYRQTYNRKDSTPNHPGYSDEEIKKANFLASLRSQNILETATKDILSPSFPNDSAPRLNSTANLRVARVKYVNNDAGFAERPTCNDPTSNGVYTPAQPYVSPPRTYPTPNWAVLGTHHTVTKKRAVKTVTKTTKENISAAKKVQKIPISLNMSQTHPLTMNADIPHIDLTMDLSQNTNTSIIHNIMPVPLNTEAQNQTVKMRIDTTQTNIITTAHNINTINLTQVPFGKDQSRQISMNVNNNGELTHLMEGSTHHETLTDDINKAQTNAEQPWINIKSDGKRIPLIMDEDDMSIKNNVEATIQPSVIKVTDTIAQSVQSEAFVQHIRNDMDVEAAVAQLHANTDENITNATQTSKTPVQSTKSYELVSTTSVTSETMSENINSNNISKPGTFESEANTTLTVSRKHIIENTVTVSLVKQIVTNPNISLPETDTLLDILNNAKPRASINQIDNSKIVTIHDNICTKEENAQTREGMELTRRNETANISLLHILSKVKQIPTKICSNIDQPDNSTIGNFNDNIFPKEEKDHTGAMGLSRIEDKNKNIFADNNVLVGDGNKKGISHETKELCDSKDDDDERLKTARKNLARLRVTENDNESERATVNIDTNNKYQIEIKTFANTDCIAQVKIPSLNGSCNAAQITHVVNNEDNQGEIGIEIDQEVNEVDVPQDNTNNENSDVSESTVDEIIFFKFQINFFRLVQERLSENNHEEFANKLHNDILDLITLSEDDDAKADMAYKCHECHNVTLYSPRQLYYAGSIILKDDDQNCQLCITFSRKYIEVLIKYITLESSLATVNNQITENSNRRDDSATGFKYVGQNQSETALHDEGDDSHNKSKKNEQQIFVTDEVSSCSKQAETSNQENPNPCYSYTPDSQKLTNNFVVKLPRNRLKESTFKALMEFKRANSNDNKPGENFNVVLQKNNIKGNNNLSNLGESTANETVTTIQGNINTRTNLINNKEMHCTSTKGNNAETSPSKSAESQNKTTTILYTNIQDNDRNKERHSYDRRSDSENATGPNPPPTNRDTITLSNSVNTNDPNEDSISKKKRDVCHKTVIGATPETQQINKTNVSQNRDCSNMNQERQSKKRKCITAETASTSNSDSNNRNTSSTTNTIDDHDKTQEKHSNKRKSIYARIEIVTSPDAEKQNLNSSPENSNDNDKNQERHSKKRKSSNTKAAPSEVAEPQNRNANNLSDKNENERHAKKRKSISADTPTIADTHDRRDNYKHKKKDLGAKISRCGEITTTQDKGNCDKDSKQPSASKINETTTSNSADSLKKKTITYSNNNNSNRNKQQPCNSDKNNEKDKNEIYDTETTPNRTTQQLNVQDNASNKNKDNDTNIARSESRKSTSADILNESSTTLSCHSTRTDQTKNNTTQNQNKETADQNNESKNNDGKKQNNNLDTGKDNEKAENTAQNHTKEKVKDVECKTNNNKKQNNDTRKDDKNEEEEDDDQNLQKALEDCFKTLKAARGGSNKTEILGNLFKTLSERLCSKESDDLPEVKITGKQEKKNQKGQVKISYKYICNHCSVSFRSLDACRSHVTDDHKKEKLEAKDCIEVRKCEYCTNRYVQQKLYNKHIKTYHKDKFSRIIQD